MLLLYVFLYFSYVFSSIMILVNKDNHNCNNAHAEAYAGINLWAFLYHPVSKPYSFTTLVRCFSRIALQCMCVKEWTMLYIWCTYNVTLTLINPAKYQYLLAYEVSVSYWSYESIQFRLHVNNNASIKLFWELLITCFNSRILSYTV